MTEQIDLIRPSPRVISIRSLDGEGLVTLQCTEVMRLPYPSLALGVELLQRGFSGSQPEVWVDELSLAAFIGQLEILDRTRSGDAVLSAMSPDEFGLRVRATDSAGHLTVRTSVARLRYMGSTPVWVSDTATIHFEIEPSELGRLLTEFRELSLLLSREDGPQSQQ